MLCVCVCVWERECVCVCLYESVCVRVHVCMFMCMFVIKCILHTMHYKHISLEHGRERTEASSEEKPRARVPPWHIHRWEPPQHRRAQSWSWWPPVAPVHAAAASESWCCPHTCPRWQSVGAYTHTHTLKWPCQTETALKQAMPNTDHQPVLVWHEKGFMVLIMVNLYLAVIPVLPVCLPDKRYQYTAGNWELVLLVLNIGT